MIDKGDIIINNKEFLKSHGVKGMRTMEEIDTAGDSEVFIKNRNFIKGPDEMMKSMFSNMTGTSYSEINVIFNILSKKQNGQELNEEETLKLYSFTDRLQSVFNSSIAGQTSRKGMFTGSLK